MSSTTIALTSFACIFGGTVLGLVLRQILPDHHLNAESKEAVKIGAGMISMMAALVLGLLVSSAKSNFDATNTAIIQGGAKIILLDRVLANYGPECQEVRRTLRQAMTATIELLWPEEAASTEVLTSTFERSNTMEKLLTKIRELKPQTEGQRALQAQAQQLGNELLLIRWQQIEQAQVTLPTTFLVIVLFWLTMLYMSFGLLAPRNATVITVMCVGALALATAIFLILEMNRPMGGTIKVSSGPMRKALEHLGRE
jgi:hypothetical protein